MHYQKKRSREVALRGRRCFEKLVAAESSKEPTMVSTENLQEENDDHSASPRVKCTPVGKNSRSCPHDSLPVRSRPNRFTSEEDRNLRIGFKRYGVYWSKILCDPELKFHPCRLPKTLRRAETLNLI